MICRDNVEKISTYLDNELDAEEASSLEAHLSVCASCRAVLRAAREEKKLLKKSFAAVKAPSHLKHRIIASIKEEAQREAAGEVEVSFFRRLLAPGPAWAFASLVLVLIAGTIYLRTEGFIYPAGEKTTTVGLYVKDITHDAYLVYRLPKRPLDIASDKTAAVETFLSEHVGFEVQIPNLAESGYTLKGGRLWHTISRISALAVYEDGSGNSLSLFEVKKERIGKKGAKTVVLDGRTFYMGGGFGFHGVVWMQHDVALGIAADLPYDDLLKIARAAAASLEE